MNSDVSCSPLSWLFQTQQNRICLGLERMQRLLKEFGHPEKKYQILHIAGTNGKGSTAAFTESLLRHAGYSTGLYTSPHLVEINERICIKGKNITTESLVEGLERLQKLIASWSEQPTFFELVTALAFDAFARAGCEVVVLETGLGGRLDATNVTEKIACAITSISYDHTEWLGPTLTHIAQEKAGIMRQGVPVVSVPQPKEVEAVLIEEAHKIGARMTFLADPLSEEVSLSLSGPHQRWNAALALALVKQAGFSIEPEVVKKAFLEAHWPGRFQKIIVEDVYGNSRTVILDGAHNVDAIEQLLKTWKEEFPTQRPFVIFGALSDKNSMVMLEKLSAIAQEVFLVPVASPRSTAPADFLKKIPKAIVFESLKKCLYSLFFDKKDFSFLNENISNTPILLTGSLFLIGEALGLLHQQEYRASMQ